MIRSRSAGCRTRSSSGIRLSSKQHLRCRGWRCDLTSPAFTLAHHRIQPSLPLVMGFPRVPPTDSEILTLLDYRAADPVAKPQLVATVNDGALLFVHASRDGLLILSDFHGRIRAVCNPDRIHKALIEAHVVPRDQEAYFVLTLGCDRRRCIGRAVAACTGNQRSSSAALA